jgi:deoxyadenosine/deoxycytidine kinase
MGAFNATDLSTLENLYEALAELLPRPDLLVYVHAPIGTILERIAQRGREFEQAIDSKLMTRLAANYEKWIDDQRWAPVLRVNSAEADYSRDEVARRAVIERVDRALLEPSANWTVSKADDLAELPKGHAPILAELP